MSLRNLLVLGIMAELAIFFLSNLTYPAIEETFRYSARYSGRLSAVIFLITFFIYAKNTKAIEKNSNLQKSLKLFTFLHLIHLGFLATNVHLNNIQLETPKIIGGAFAYLLIVLAPFYLYRVNKGIQIFYFYYVSLVMILTYLARARGDFEGGEPSWFHYTALGVFIIASLYFAKHLVQKSKITS